MGGDAVYFSDAAPSMAKITREFESLIRSVPGPCVAFDLDFTILALNDAYLRATRVTRDVIGRNVFEVFPENPEAGEAGGPKSLRSSLERVLETRAADRMPRIRYDIPRPDVEGGGFE